PGTQPDRPRRPGHGYRSTHHAPALLEPVWSSDAKLTAPNRSLLCRLDCSEARWEDLPARRLSPEISPLRRVGTLLRSKRHGYSVTGAPQAAFHLMLQPWLGVCASSGIIS